MSAIWGAIDLYGKEISQDIKNILRNAYDKCVIDRYEEKSCGNVYMGCGIQYFTDEASYESLPITEKDNYFTADVVLDNREEIAESIGINLNKEMADGALLYKAYATEGNTSLNELLGAYCFVWYNKKNNVVELVSDAVGNRCLYYYYKDGVLYFSTLLLPLAKISGEALNDRWLVDFLAMDYLFMINEAEETPYQDIYRIAPAQYVSVTKEKIEKQQYWNPHKIVKRHERLSDEEYKKQFRELWDRVVKSNIRTGSNVSIMLSGGLDSTAVAAVAAPYLKSQGKQLYSYTSVPDKQYKSDNSGCYIEDESEDVLKTVEFFGNIVPEFVDLNGNNAWDMHKAEMEGLEMPYKTIQNALWLVESMKKAYKNNSRLMLNGSYGNTTISYTELTLYMNLLFSEKKYMTLNKEITLFASKMGFDKAYAWKQIIRESKEENFENPYPYRNSFVNREYADALGAKKRIEQIAQNSKKTDGLKTGYRDNVFELLPLRQIGEIVTKHTLMTGVLLRDPTKDKRILEFCASIPMEQFCKKGIDRRLVKEYLSDIIPKHIIRFSKQGKQSADVQFRISKDWERIRKEWLDILERCRSSRYVDVAYARRQLLEMPDISKYSNYDVTRYIYTLMVLEFETEHTRRKETDDIRKDDMEEPLISVIVPVYNTKDCLQKCVNSIINQTYKNLEIILVDDESTDGSGELCDSFCAIDSRIRVIHQKNQGVSAARNAALDAAGGEYIGFVDSDDWIDAEMYKKLYEIMKEEAADIACCRYRNVRKGKVTDYSDGRVRIYNADQMLDTMLTGHDRCLVSPAVWNRLYKRKLFDHIRFPGLRKYEDKVINVLLLQYADKAVFLNKSYYNYVYREDSLSATEKTYDDMCDYIKSNNMIVNVVKEKLCKESMEKIIFDYFCIILDNYCTARKRGKDKRLINILKKEIHQISNKRLRYVIYQKDVRKKDRLCMWIATYSPHLYYLLINF